MAFAQQASPAHGKTKVKIADVLKARSAQKDNGRAIKITEFNSPVMPAALLSAGSGTGSGSGNTALATSPGEYGTMIGFTNWEIQSWGGHHRMIQQNADGSVSAIWQYGRDAAVSGRMAAYNRFNGTSWLYSGAATNFLNYQVAGATSSVTGAALSSGRIGYPSLANTSTAENIVNYIIPASDPLTRIASYTKGFGASPWSANRIGLPEGRFQHVTSNSTTIHAISPTLDDANYPELVAELAFNSNFVGLSYLKSNDNGATWTGTYVDDYSNAAGYTGVYVSGMQIDANNNNVAFITTAEKFSPSAGLESRLFKSTDNGVTWTSRTVQKTDEATSANYKLFNDGAYSLVIDNSGITHIAVGDGFVISDGRGTNLNSLQTNGGATPASSSLMYWNETFPASPTASLPSIATPVDADDDGFYSFPTMTGWYPHGLVGYPSLSTDAEGNIFALYSAIVENTTDANGDPLRDLYYIATRDKGKTWSKPFNIASEFYGVNDGSGGTGTVEEAWPNSVQHIGTDNIIHSHALTDATFGLAYDASTSVYTSGTWLNNAVMYSGVNKNDILDKYISAEWARTYCSNGTQKVKFKMPTNFRPGTMVLQIDNVSNTFLNRSQIIDIASLDVQPGQSGEMEFSIPSTYNGLSIGIRLMYADPNVGVISSSTPFVFIVDGAPELTSDISNIDGQPACASSGATYLYSIGANNVESFNWTLSPAYAGTIAADFNNAAITFNPLFAGTATIKTSAKNGCDSTVAPAYTLNLRPSSAPVISPAGPVNFCRNGSIMLTSSLKYGNLWSTGERTQSISVSANGTYTLRAVSPGCTSLTASISVLSMPTFAPDAPLITFTGSNTVCNGDTVLLTSSFADGYLWSNGATTRDIKVTASGSYSVYAVSGSCTSVAATPVTVNIMPALAVPTVTTTGPTSFCEGSNTALITANTPGADSYIWSTGSTGNELLVTNTGSYSVRSITGACTSAASEPVSITVTPIPAKPAITVTGSLTICIPGDMAILTAPAADSYLWSNGGTTQTMAAAPGSYTVTVINNGCSSSASDPVVVLSGTSPTAPSVTVNGASRFCRGGSTVLHSNFPDMNYWSTGQTTQDITVTDGGTYTLARVQGSCTSAAQSVVIVVNEIPTTPVIQASGPIGFCTGGSVTLSAPDADDYLWSDGSTRQTLTATASGTYTVQTIIANCTSAASATVSVSVADMPAKPRITAGGPLSFCSGDSLSLTAPAGFSYLWSTGETTERIFAHVSGSYTVVTIAGGSACTSGSAQAVVVTVTDAPAAGTISAGGALSFCQGGSVRLTATSGSGGYVWSNGETTQSITATASGNYTVRLTEGACTSAASAPATVNVTPTPVTPVIGNSGPLSFCQGGTVKLYGVPGFRNIWSSGETTDTITVNQTGTFTLTTVSNGCSSTVSDPVAVTVNALPLDGSISASGPLSFCSGSSVTLTAQAGFQYIWSNGATTRAISAATAGSYSVRLISNGCTGAASPVAVVAVTATPATPSITASGDTNLCTGGSVVLTSSSAIGNTWSNGETTQSITVTTTGVYTVAVSAGTCTSEAAPSRTVTVNPIPVAPLITNTGSSTLCQGDSVILNSNTPLGNLWSNGATTTSITVKAAGNYWVKTTALGCTSAASANYNVVVNPRPATVVLTRSGDSLIATPRDAASYKWTLDGDVQSVWTTWFITSPPNGAYSVVAVNSFGCSSPAASNIIAFVGTAPYIGSNLSLMPNPAANELSIQGLEQESGMEILDNLGRVVFKATVSPGRTTDISALPAGMYHVRVANRSMKLVKN